MTVLGYALEYLLSWPGLVAFTLTFVSFGLKTYDVFAKVWPATTGKHVTEGWITWSEFVSPELVLIKQAIPVIPSEGLISYSYRVNNEQHNGTIPITRDITEKEVAEHLYKGAKIQVFYSPKLPAYSFARQPPAQSVIAGTIVAKWFVIPMAILNLLALFIWFLANA